MLAVSLFNRYRRALRRPDETWPWMPERQQNALQHDQRWPWLFTGINPFKEIQDICWWLWLDKLCPCNHHTTWCTYSFHTVHSWGDEVISGNSSVRWFRYICIDKACLVLWTCVSNGSWETWRKTSRLIVDTNHYTNHCVTDNLCHKWCNPAPLDGSAPNLVVVDTDTQGM